MNKVKAFWNKFFDFLDNVLAYILTILGILVSNYAPMLKTTGEINVVIDWWRIGIAALIAVIIIGKQETLAIDENGSVDKSKAGRKKKFSIRMANALAQGIAWAQLVQLAN